MEGVSKKAPSVRHVAVDDCFWLGDDCFANCVTCHQYFKNIKRHFCFCVGKLCSSIFLLFIVQCLNGKCSIVKNNLQLQLSAMADNFGCR